MLGPWGEGAQHPWRVLCGVVGTQHPHHLGRMLSVVGGPQHPCHPWRGLRGDHSSHGGCPMGGGCSEGAGTTAPTSPGAEWDAGTAAPAAPMGNAPLPGPLLWGPGQDCHPAPGWQRRPRSPCASVSPLPCPAEGKQEIRCRRLLPRTRSQGVPCVPPRRVCRVSSLGAAGLCPRVAVGLRPANSRHTWGIPEPQCPERG